MKKLLLILITMSLSLFANTTISFKAGWNFIGLNNTTNLSTDTTFKDSSKVKIVWKYINDPMQPSQGWHIYTSDTTLKTKAEDLGLSYSDTLSSSQGAWVYALKDFTYTVASKNHTLTNSSISINDGWNLLSAVDNANINITDNIFTSNKVTYAYRDGEWYTKYSSDGTSTSTKILTNINSYEAFWIYKEATAVNLNVISIVKKGDNTATDTLISAQCGITSGIAIYTGADTNGNGILDITEYANITPIIVCDGVAGADGSDGNATIGTDGTDGTTSLIKTEILSIGSNDCSFGGVKIYTGIDSNNNNILDTEEYTTSSTAVVCNGTSYVAPVEDTNITFEGAKLTGTVLASQGLGRRLYGYIGYNNRTLKLVPKGVSSQDKPKPYTDKIRVNKHEQLSNTFDISVSSYGTFTVDDIPSGADYSLVYVDTTNNLGKKIDDISLRAGETKNIDISSALTLGDIKLNIQSLASNANISGAKVILAELEREVLTDSNGDAIIDTIPQGNYSLRIDKDGYVSKYITFNVTANQTTDLSTLFLNSQKGSLTGKVVSTTLTTLENIVVYAKASDGSVFSTLTNSTGNYTFNALPVEVGYSLLANAHGYTTSKVDNLDVTLGNTTVANDIAISKLIATSTVSVTTGETIIAGGGTIAGFARFADKDGLNHAGIIVAVEGTDYEAITSRDGSFILNNIPQGNYTLNVYDSNYDITTLKFKRVVAGATTILRDINLDRVKGLVSGTVSLDGSLDNTGVKVSITGTNYFTYTDASGKWSLEIPTGNYNGVTYSKDLFTEVVNTNTVTVTQNGSYIVAPDTITQTAANLIGKITVTGKTDFSPVSLSISGTSGDANGVTSTISPNTDGTFEIISLPLGNYNYTIVYPDGLHETIIDTFTLDTSKEILDLGTINLRTSYVAINSNAIYTNSKNVTLSIGNSDAVQMQIVEGGTTYPKENIATTKSFTLSNGDGEKTVTVNMFDSAGSPMPTISDTIILDTILNVNSFTLSGASKKGDTLKLSLNLGETDANIFASIPSIADNLKLLDNGTGGDSSANDGIYERTVTINTPAELDLIATANITDIAGNTKTSTSNTLSLSTNPSIQNIQVTSNVASATMTITFTTDEPTTSKIYYGVDTSYGSNQIISSSLSTNHSITLSNLTPNVLTYFKLEIKDEALNITNFTSQGKLAPPTPTNFNIEAGSNEVALVWDEVTSDGVVGYNVYRSDNGNAFVKVNNVIITDSYFLDDTAVNGVTYSYKVATLDDNDNESEQTTEISATPLSSLAGPTEIAGGIIDKNTIWLSSRSPYNITSDMKVKEGSTLLWLPGTSVNLSGDDREVLAEGTLNAIGSESNNILLNVTNYTENTSDMMNQVHAGYIKSNANGVVNVDYSNIINAGLLGYSTIKIDNSVVNLNSCTSTKYFQVTSIKDTNITELKSKVNGSTCYADLSIGSLIIKDSNLIYAGDHIITDDYSMGIRVQAESIVNSSVQNGRVFMTNKANDSKFQNVLFTGYINIENSVLNNITIDYSEVININYSVIENIKSFYSTNYMNIDMSYNYWGTTDLNTITELVNYSPTQSDDQYSRTLYPIISTADFDTADFDNDGILDIIDNDNDNDGYSDLQEDKESDPQYGSIYNPLDAASHPNSEADNDYDGIPDSTDEDDDNDGLSDSDELNYQTNPFIKDSDGDGVNDGDEIAYKYDPLDKTNYPLIGDQSDIHIDNSYANSDGYVYLSGSSLTFSNITIETGTKIMIDKDLSLIINDSEIFGNKTNPVIFRGSGAGTGRLTLDNSSMSYANIKIALYLSVNSNSTISYSDIEFHDGQISSSASITDSFIKGTNRWHNYGVVKNTYLYRDIYNNGLVDSSYVVSILEWYNEGSINNSYINKIKMWNNNTNINNSIVDSFYAKNIEYNTVINSDIKMYSSGVISFFNGVFISKLGTDYFYDGLGSPEDQIGDGVAETVFEIDGTSYTVDGITNPRSTKNFPDWVNDPAVKQYFWDPTNVGCLWDSSNPDVFPEP